MDQFKPEGVYDIIGLCLVLGTILVIAYRMIVYYCENTPVYDPMIDGPEELHIMLEGVDSEYDADQIVGKCAKRTSGHSAQILADITGLRRDLPPARNMTGAAQARYSINPLEQDGQIMRMAGAMRSEPIDPTYFQREWLKSHPHLQNKGFQQHLNARYAGATETEGGHHD